MLDRIAAVNGVIQVGNPKIPGRINPRVPMKVQAAIMDSNV